MVRQFMPGDVEPAQAVQPAVDVDVSTALHREHVKAVDAQRDSVNLDLQPAAGAIEIFRRERPLSESRDDPLDSCEGEKHRIDSRAKIGA